MNELLKFLEDGHPTAEILRRQYLQRLAMLERPHAREDRALEILVNHGDPPVPAPRGVTHA